MNRSGFIVGQQHKSALILSSGAMRGAYQCGVLKAFKERDLKFDVVIGSSAGAYNGIRYVSNQMDICEKIYVIDLSDGQFIKPRNLLVPGRHFLDLDYLIDEVCRMESRVIDMDEVMRSGMEFYVTALELDTMVTRFFDAKKTDIHPLLKATAALPFLYSKAVMIDGKRYLDGGLLEPIPVNKAIQLGCTELYVVLNRAQGDEEPSRVKRLMDRIPGRMFRLMAQHNRIKAEVDRFLYQPHAEFTITVVRPRQPMPVGRFTSDRESLQAAIDVGYSDGMKLIHSGGAIQRLLR